MDRQYCSTAFEMVCNGYIDKINAFFQIEQNENQTWAKLVKNLPSWYSSSHSSSCKKLIGLLRDSNKSTIDELCPSVLSDSN